MPVGSVAGTRPARGNSDRRAHPEPDHQSGVPYPVMEVTVADHGIPTPQTARAVQEEQGHHLHPCVGIGLFGKPFAGSPR